MNKKGFFTAVIAGITVILLVTMFSVQQNFAKNRQAEYYQRAIFELKTGAQNTQYLLDKSASDAMADCINITCVQGTAYKTKIMEYFKTITDNATAYYGIQCDTITVPAVASGTDFSFDLKCYKNMLDGFRAEYKKTITLKKEITFQMAGVCEIQVKDAQSGTCDALINKAACS